MIIRGHWGKTHSNEKNVEVRVGEGVDFGSYGSLKVR